MTYPTQTHKTIPFMMTTKNPITAQLQTWINYLSSLNFNIIFSEGFNQGYADMFSQNSCDTFTKYLMQHKNPTQGKLKNRTLTIILEIEEKSQKTGKK